MKFEYYIDSSLDLDEIIDTIYQYIKSPSGKLIYYENDQEITKELSLKELKKEAIETFNDEKWPIIKFENLEIIIGEEDIQINSQIKLKLEEFDAEETIK
jgi:hypothetical protein